MRAWLERLEEWLIALLLGLMTVISFAQVVARYVFNYSFVWALELVTFLFAWMIFLGMSYGVRVGAHIGVDALVKALGPGKARALSAAAALLCIVYSIIILIGGSVYVAKMYEVGIEAQDIPIPQWVPRLVLPLGFVLLIVRFGELLFRIVTGRERGMHLSDEVADAMKYQAEGDEPAPGAADRK